MLPRELCKIMADAAANVHKERGISFGFDTLDQSLLDREKSLVHPAGSTLTVSTHVMVELRSERGVCLQKIEEVEVCIVSELVRAVLRIVWFLVAGLRSEEVELQQG